MSKNIVMQELTANRYETLYPKTSTSQLEGDISAISGYSKAWNVGDILVTSRTNLSDNWLLCNGTQIKREDYSELKNILSESGPEFNWEEKSEFTTKPYAQTKVFGRGVEQIGRKLYYFDRGASSKELVAYVINMDSLERSEIRFTLSVDFFPIRIWKDEATNIIYLLSGSNGTSSYFVKFENEQFSYLGEFISRYWGVSLKTRVFKKDNIFYLINSGMSYSSRSGYVSTSNFQSFQYHDPNLKYWHSTPGSSQYSYGEFFLLDIHNDLFWAYGAIMDNNNKKVYYYKFFSTPPDGDILFNKDEWTYCSQVTNYYAQKANSSSFTLGITKDCYWLQTNDKNNAQILKYSQDFLNWNTAYICTESCGNYFMTASNSQLYVLDAINTATLNPLTFQNECVTEVTFDILSKMYFMFTTNDAKAIKLYTSFDSLILPETNISSANQSPLYTYIKVKDGE